MQPNNQYPEGMKSSHVWPIHIYRVWTYSTLGLVFIVRSKYVCIYIELSELSYRNIGYITAIEGLEVFEGTLLRVEFLPERGWTHVMHAFDVRQKISRTTLIHTISHVWKHTRSRSLSSHTTPSHIFSFSASYLFVRSVSMKIHFNISPEIKIF